MNWQLHVHKDNEAVCEPISIEGAVDLGRQDSGLPKEQGMAITGPKPVSYPMEAGMTRIVLASVKEQRLHRHIQVEPLAEPGMFRLTNLSRNVAIQVVDGPTVMPNSSFDGRSPLEFCVDRWTMRAQAGETSTVMMQMLPDEPAPPGSVFKEPSSHFSSFMHSIGTGSIDPVQLIRWLQATMDVLQEAASSREFLPRAARAVVELIELDGCRVLLCEGKRWNTAAEWSRPGIDQSEWRPSFQLLEQMRQRKRTVWQVPDQNMSVMTLTAVVVAPILNPKGEVIGAIYGDRGSAAGTTMLRPISQLEAMLAEVLARSLAAGLARLDYEQAALRALVQLESHFSPKLARQLMDDPEIFKGRDAQVTILFCDLRKFSTNSEHLGPEATVQWIGKVMGVMSDCVERNDGVVVDYIGDEIMAMWGAIEQPDHAIRACRAALEMLEHLPALNDEWNARLKTPMDLGIGINSGMARVGNVGSGLKFKYGALGNTTNLASRVQGATKHLKTRLLITRATKDLLDDTFAVRRIGSTKVVNISEPVELFELAYADKPIWTALQMEYEVALTKFESRSFGTAVRVLGNLLNEHADDGPALVLLSRAVGCMVKEPGPDFQLWELPGK